MVNCIDAGKVSEWQVKNTARGMYHRAVLKQERLAAVSVYRMSPAANTLPSL